jgi:hypothetical protein
MISSEILYMVVFVAVFPALWLLASVLDRIFPTASEIEARRRVQARRAELLKEDEAELQLTQSASIESKRADKRGRRSKGIASKQPRDPA